MFRTVALFLLAGLLVPPQEVDALLKSAREKLDQGDYKGSLAAAEQAIAAAPDRGEGYLSRGKARFALTDLPSAEKDFDRAIALDPSSAEAFYSRGRLRMRRDNPSGALTDLDRCLELGVKDPDLFVWKGNCLSLLRRLEEADGEFTRAITSGAPSVKAWTMRGTTRTALGRYREAVADLTQAIALSSSDASTFDRRAIAYLGAQSWENALRDIRKAEQLAGNTDDGRAHLAFLARCRMGQGDAAREAIRKHRSRPPGKDAPSDSRILLDFDEGKVTEAQLLESAGKDSRPDALHAVATRRLLEGKSDEAIALFKQAVDAGREDLSLYAILAKAEVDAQRRAQRDALRAELEMNLKAQGSFETVYEVDLPRKAGENTIRTLTCSVDPARAGALLVLNGRNEAFGSDSQMVVHLKDALLNSWSTMEGDSSYVTADLRFMSEGIASIDHDVDQILPDPTRTTPDVFVNCSVNLEGKPGANLDGFFRFSVGLSTSPGSWIKESVYTEDPLEENQGDVVFPFKARRKKVFIERATGVLKGIETLDYDGTTKRSIRLKSFRKIDALPKVIQPPHLKVLPFDVGQMRAQTFQTEEILYGQVADLLNRWDAVMKAGKEVAVVELVTRWAARHADGYHAYAVRSLAGQRIQRTLDLGTPASKLLQNSEADAKQFAEGLTPEERKILVDAREQTLAELASRMETGLYQNLVDNRMHGVLREVVRRALEPETVEARRKAVYGQRLEALYREELASRTAL